MNWRSIDPRPFCPVALLLLLAAVGVSSSTATSPPMLHLDDAWIGPSIRHPLGYGEGGIELLPFVSAAVLRAALLASVVSMSGMIAGTILGTVGGLARGKIPHLVHAATDFVQAFPTFLLALAVMAVSRRPSRVLLGGVFLFGAWAPFARLALLQSGILRDALFVEAARALGGGTFRILRVHILPNLVGPALAQLGTSMAGIVLGEAALSFIGLGPADGISLGAVIEQGTAGMLRAPHVLVVGALAVALLSSSLQFATDRIGSPRETQAPRGGKFPAN